MNSHDHNHSHDHDHSKHGHDHSHAPADFTKAFAIGIALNSVFVVIEAGYGYHANSLALMADAGHNLSDVLGLLLAWGAAWLGKQRPSGRFTYGYGHSSILAALVNAILLLVAVGGIFWEAIVRFGNPEAVSSSVIMSVAAIGILINGATAILFVSGRKSDLNIRGAYMHMAADALVSLGVVVTGAIISFTGWIVLDSAVSIVIGITIIFGTWSLLRESFILALGAVPVGFETNKLKTYLSNIEGVSAIHDLHVWAMSTKEIALTVHLMMPAGHPGDAILAKISEELALLFKIKHVTIQIELGDTEKLCRLQPDEVV